MRMSLLLLPLIIFSAGARAEGPAPTQLKYSPECILRAVAQKKHITLREDVKIPAVYLESKTPLRQFQDAIEPQWHIRPEVFLNAYVPAREEIYLIDQAQYYQKNGRYIDDSLAHELTHFVQVRYQHYDINGEDDSLEGDAIDVQSWFRDEFMKTGKSPCPN